MSERSSGRRERRLVSSSVLPSTPPPPIYVVVVESHDHVLEHVHWILRRKQRLTTWSMLHFDSHPDLACPVHIPARYCFLPRCHQQQQQHNDDNNTNNNDDDDNSFKDLYERLEETSDGGGIAEWILPLVLASELTHIHWIKPPKSHQLPMGQHDYHVGAWISGPEQQPQQQKQKKAESIQSFLDLPSSARVRVDWNHPYYLDDDSVVPTEKLLLAKLLHLTVSELHHEHANEEYDNNDHDNHDDDGCNVVEFDTTTTETTAADWALDICLDYFACYNPFLVDIQHLDAIFAKALANVVVQSRLCDLASMPSERLLQHALDGVAYQQDLCHFRALLEQVLRKGCLNDKTHDCSDVDNDDCIQQLAQYYACKETGLQLVETLIQSLFASTTSSAADRMTLIDMAVEAIPNLTMPHDDDDDDDDATMQQIANRMEQMTNMLLLMKKKTHLDTTKKDRLLEVAGMALHPAIWWKYSKHKFSKVFTMFFVNVIMMTTMKPCCGRLYLVRLLLHITSTASTKMKIVDFEFSLTMANGKDPPLQTLLTRNNYIM